jgi:hypothetical protein
LSRPYRDLVLNVFVLDRRLKGIGSGESRRWDLRSHDGEQGWGELEDMMEGQLCLGHTTEMRAKKLERAETIEYSDYNTCKVRY